MRKKLVGGVALALVFTAGCGSYPVLDRVLGALDTKFGRGGDAEYPVGCVDRTVGYGMVNWWYKDPVKMADTAAANGVGIIHIAYFGWADSELYASPEKLVRPYRALREATERNNQILFVEIANDNKGSGKYGDDKKGLGQYTEQLKQAAKDIQDIGFDWLQPVGETHSDAGKAFEIYCAGIFPKEKLVYNGNSRPGGPASWSSMFAWHPANISVLPPKGAIAVNDHSGILIQLYGAGWQGDARANPDAVRDWARRMKANGNIVILYAFGQRTVDIPALKALEASPTDCPAGAE